MRGNERMGVGRAVERTRERDCVNADKKKVSARAESSVQHGKFKTNLRRLTTVFDFCIRLPVI